jgi:hypothetical protein
MAQRRYTQHPRAAVTVATNTSIDSAVIADGLLFGVVSRTNSLVVQNQTTPTTFSQYGSSLAVPLAIGAHRYRQRIYVAQNGTAQGSRPAVPTLRVLETISTLAALA